MAIIQKFNTALENVDADPNEIVNDVSDTEETWIAEDTV